MEDYKEIKLIIQKKWDNVFCNNKRSFFLMTMVVSRNL